MGLVERETGRERMKEGERKGEGQVVKINIGGLKLLHELQKRG